jgi:outer membrane receptor for Fe3+-dicitrate
VRSQLFEEGAKFEFIPNKLFGSVAGYYQTRNTQTVANNVYSPQLTEYRGVESQIKYQPTKELSLGANYSWLEANYVGANLASLTSDANGVTADGSTLISTTPAASNGNYRVPGLPKNSFNFYADYRFDNGFGVKGDMWVTSEWNANVTATAVVPWQYQADVAFYYEKKLAHSDWRAEIDLLNVTDERNWSYYSDSVLLANEPFGIQGKISAKF